MSALPPIADIEEGIAECPLMTQSGHWRHTRKYGSASAPSALRAIVAGQKSGHPGDFAFSYEKCSRSFMNVRYAECESNKL